METELKTHWCEFMYNSAVRNSVFVCAHGGSVSLYLEGIILNPVILADHRQIQLLWNQFQMLYIFGKHAAVWTFCQNYDSFLIKFNFDAFSISKEKWSYIDKAT